MSRTRSRFGESETIIGSQSGYNPWLGTPFNYPITQSYFTSFEYMIDENNGKLRPDSPCHHGRLQLKLTPYSYEYGGENFSKIIPNRNPSDILTVVEALLQEEVDALVRRLTKSLYDRYAAFTKRFSSINFLAELTDVSALFKRLDKYQYIDYEFGLSPMLGDMSTAMNALMTTEQAIQAKLNSLKHPVPIKIRRNFDLPISQEVAFYPNDPCVISGKLNVTLRLKAEMRVFLPVFQNSELIRDYIKLDLEGFHPDAATIWEAIPFSWLVDWFLPIGNALENVSGNWFNPLATLDGNLSYICQGELEMDNPRTHPHGRSGPSKIRVKVYHRDALSLEFDSRGVKTPVFRLPVPDPRKLALVNDIWGKGSSVDKLNRLGKRAKKRLKKVLPHLPPSLPLNKI